MLCGRSSQLLPRFECHSSVRCLVQPQSSSLGANDGCADEMSGVGSVCGGCVLLYSPTSYFLLRRKPRSVGRGGAAGRSAGSSGLDARDAQQSGAALRRCS